MKIFNRRPFSLAYLLTAWYASSAFILVIIAVGFLYWSLEKHINDDDRKLLEGKYIMVDEILSHHKVESSRVSLQINAASESTNAKKVFARVVNSRDEVVAESKGMENEVGVGFMCPDKLEFSHCFASSISQKPLQILTSQIKPYVSGNLRVQLAIDRTSEEELLSDYKKTSIWLLIGTILLSSGVGLLIAKKGMKPIRDIADGVNKVSSHNLSERIALVNLPRELRSLAFKFNGMMDRLELSFSQLSQFSADIAHDLRTPINNLRGEAEVGLGRLRTVDEYQEILGSCLEECDRISNLIDSLLFIARSEHQSTVIKREDLRIFTEVIGVVEIFDVEAEESQNKFDIRIDESLVFPLDKILFQRAIANVISNSLKHTKNGMIRICAWIIDRELIVEVDDTGAGISEVDLPNIFQRFYRGDKSRSNSGKSTGLGLSIVASILELHDGSVSVSSKIGSGTKIAMTFRNIKEYSH